MHSKSKNTAPAKAVEQEITLTVILPKNTRVTPELIQQLDKFLFFTDGGKRLWDAHYALVYEFLNSGKKPTFLTEELNQDSYLLGKLLAYIKYKV
jgi:hypothetical protein